MKNTIKYYLLFASMAVFTISCKKDLKKDDNIRSVIAGTLPTGTGGTGTRLALVDSFDLRADESVRILPMFTGSSMAFSGNKLYIAGGKQGYYKDMGFGRAKSFQWVYSAGSYINIFREERAIDRSLLVKGISLMRSGMAAAAVGDKVIFAGGEFKPLNFEGASNQAVNDSASKRVDIYDTKTATWQKALLSVGRTKMAVTTLGTKAYFAGGLRSNGIDVTNVIDVYDAATGNWSTMKLSSRRCGATAAAVGTKIFFAGGGLPSGKYRSSDGAIIWQFDNTIDIYDTATGLMTTTFLSPGLEGLDLSSCVINDKVFIGGGMRSGPGNSGSIDIYTNEGDFDSTISFTTDRSMGTASFARAGNLIAFAGGQPDSIRSTVEVLNYATGVRSSILLSTPGNGTSLLAYDDKIFVAPGYKRDDKNEKYTGSTKVYILKLRP